MWSFSRADAPSPHGMLLDTLEDFDVVATLGGGAVLFPRRFSNKTQMREYLHAAVAAVLLRLSSIDYARRRYVLPTPERDLDPALASYMRAYYESKTYILACAESMVSNDAVKLELGTFAASVALERLPSSLLSTHLMYRLGLNYEGDAVARQTLEQIAWAVSAAGLVDEDELRRLKTARSVHKLKKLIPYTGEFYGRLSRTTHASLEEHQRVFKKEGDQPWIVLSWSRMAWSALNLLQLADLWVVGYEWTQREHMTAFRALDPTNDFAPRPDREFLQLVRSIVQEVEEAEKDVGLTSEKGAHSDSD